MENRGESVPGLSKSIKASWREEEERIQSKALQVFPLTLWLLLCVTFECVGIACMQFKQLWLIPHWKSCSNKHKEEIVPVSQDEISDMKTLSLKGSLMDSKTLESSLRLKSVLLV